MLTPTQIGEYEERGFTLVEGAVPPDLLAELRAGTDEIVDQALRRSQPAPTTAARPENAGTGPW